MIIYFFNSYNPNYARNKVVVHALKKNKIKLIEHNENSSFILRQTLFFIKSLFTKFDIMWVAYGGYLDIYTAKLICILKRKPLIFDIFASRWDSEKEYGEIRQQSLQSFFLYLTDKLACILPNKILLDTIEHIDYFIDTFQIDHKKFDWFFIGANEEIFYPKKIKNKKFTVLFYAIVTPMHGFEKIIKAAELLKNKNIKFILIGRGWRFRDAKEKYNYLKNVEFKDSVEFNKIPNEIAKADICLGIFGDSNKAQRVIPNKIFEPLAMAKPIITMRSNAVAPYFTHKKNIYLIDNPDAKKISKAILELKNDIILKNKIAIRGRELFEKQFSEKKIGEQIIKILKGLK